MKGPLCMGGAPRSRRQAQRDGRRQTDRRETHGMLRRTRMPPVLPASRLRRR